jgi:catechol 2,3-dioxygenase-like lactoylglutathione lyase family enzyme
MKITGIGWMGVRTADPEALVQFFTDVLGLDLDRRDNDFWVADLPDGSQVEIFGESSAGKDHFSTGPVVGLLVDDLAAARAELTRNGVELLGEEGESWQHFRGPDGRVYEITQSEGP